MAPTDPETWTHGPSIIKENELREVAALLGKGFRVHHPDAVGGISLSHNPNPQKYMVMQYHSVENGFRLPLHGLLRDLYLHFEFAPGQLTANAHNLYPHNHFPIFEKVEFKHEKWSLRYFVIEFPAHSPLDLPGVVLRRSISRTKFAAAELAEGVYNTLREKEGLVSHHSLQDAQLYKKAGFYHPLGPDPFPFECVPSPERSKAPSSVESNPAMSSPGNQFQGNSTALAIRKPTVALEAVPISAIPGLRRPIPSQKRPREGVIDDDFLPKKSKGGGTPASPSPLSTLGSQNTTPVAAPGGFELPNPDSLDHQADGLSDQAPLNKPVAQSQPEANNTSPQTATAPPEVEEEIEGQKEPEISSATEKEVDAQTELETPPLKEIEVEEQRATGALPKMTRKPEKQSEPEGQCSTPTPPAFNVPIRRKFTPQTYPAFKEGWAGFSRGLISMQASHGTIQANLEKMKESLKEPTIPQARLDLLALNALYSMEQAQQSLLTLTEEYLGGALGNYRAVVALKEKELAARALQQKVDSLEQLAQALREENARLKENSSTELATERSRVQSLQEQIAAYKRGTQDLEMQFDRFREQISILESKASASEDKVGSLEAELMEARRLALEKLKEERQTASELRSKKDELEKAIAAHQEEVVTLSARAEALYEEGKFDMQHCIYEAIRSGLPAHRSLDDFISYYGLPLPLSPPDSRVDPGS
ncbi:unnamed protein product [Cuscuta campestris]|uniref:Uncharacterized protein n=1 Tax=Cuscuta campestris TaxID=132261 RepID=A0A484KVH0_9ASTE|nr:unnamed protein product [Cuscuta campestris]